MNARTTITLIIVFVLTVGLQAGAVWVTGQLAHDGDGRTTHADRAQGRPVNAAEVLGATATVSAKPAEPKVTAAPAKPTTASPSPPPLLALTTASTTASTTAAGGETADPGRADETTPEHGQTLTEQNPPKAPAPAAASGEAVTSSEPEAEQTAEPPAQPQTDQEGEQESGKNWETADAPAPSPETPPESETITVAAADAPAEFELLEPNWLREQPPRNFTLQLNMDGSVERLRAFAEEQGLQGALAYYRLYRPASGTYNYALVTGSYSGYGEAQRAMQELLAGSPGLKPWIRRISDVQKQIR